MWAIWGQIIYDWGQAIIRDEEYHLVMVSFSLFCHYWIFSKDLTFLYTPYNTSSRGFPQILISK